MINDQTDYELFISYARLDNQPIPVDYPQGWVSALVEQIRADHRRFETSPLRIFFDTKEIKDMHDWRDRILGALRRSKVLLICLSPNYFKSEPCTWEWHEYLARQHQKLVGSEPHATVYFVEVPGSNEQENARRLDAIMGKNFTDLRPYFPRGAAAMQEEAVRLKMAALGLSVWERLQRSRRALSVPGRIREMTPYFVGRTREIADLHRLVGVGKIGLVTTVHGLGGQGKTELAIAYARGYADCYPLGLWQIEAEHKHELLPLIGTLAMMPEFGYTPSDREKNDAHLLGRAVLHELARRAEAVQAANASQAPAALLILDNVSEGALLGGTQLATLPKVDWLRLIATTRLDPNQLDPAKKHLGTVEVDSLDPENALRLIVDHLPTGRFASPADEAAARAIVHELGGFTLAVEQVAVFLGLNEGIVTPVEYLERLRAEGLTSTDALVDASAEQSILHQRKLLKPILDSMLEPLGAAGRTLLQFAALLPPERIPWPWLKELTIARHPELGEKRPGHPDPWLTLRRQVQGLRFLTGSREDSTARMHRLIAAHLQVDRDTAMDTALRTLVAQRADALYQQQGHPADWELDSLLEAIPHLLSAEPEHRLAVDGMFLSDKALDYRDLPTAFALLTSTGKVIRTLAESDATNAQLQRDLSISYERLGDVSVSAGDLTGAKRYYEQSLTIRKALAASDATNAQLQRDLSISYERLGDVSESAGDLTGAKRYFEQSLAIARTLAESDATNAQLQRDLSISFNKLGDVSVSAGDLTGAKRYYEQSLTIRKALAESDATNAQLQRDLSISFNKLGGVSESAGDLTGAKRYFEQDLAITRTLAESDATNAQLQRDLSNSYERLGDVSVSAGDLTGAKRYFEQSLTIRKALAASDATNAQLQRDVAVSYAKLAGVAESSGDPPTAVAYYRQCLGVFDRMANKGWHISPQDQRFIEYLRTKID